MIVRILHEGQYRLPGPATERLHTLDQAIVADLGRLTEAEFRKRFGDMVDVVRREGSAIPEAEIHESDLILPSADMTLEEARALFQPQGAKVP